MHSEKNKYRKKNQYFKLKEYFETYWIRLSTLT